MDHRSAEGLIQEYLRSDNAQIRRNALTAVSAAGLASCYKDVVRMAISDPDPAVRARAEEEIAASGNPVAPEYAQALAQMIDSPRGLDAFLLAGRICARGSCVPLTAPFRKRISLASEERFSNRDVPRRLVAATAVAACVNFFAVLYWLDRAIASDDGLGLLGACSLGCLLPWLLVLAARRWWRPVQIEADRLAALLVEFGVLAVAGAITAAIGISFFTKAPVSAPVTVTNVLVSLLAGVLSFCAVRAGAVAAHGSVTAPALNAVIEFLAGTAAGALVLTLIAAGLGSPDDPLTSGVWSVLLPCLPLLAFVFARVDSSTAARFPVRPPLGFVSRLIAFPLILALVFPASIPLMSVRTIHRQTQLTANGKIVPVEKVPYSETLRVNSEQSVRLDVKNNTPAAGRLDLALLNGDQTFLMNPFQTIASATGDDPSIDKVLQPGRYTINISRDRDTAVPGVHADPVLAQLRARFMSGLHPVERAPLECTLHVVMSPPRDHLTEPRP